MKRLTYIMMMLAAVLFTACMNGEWEDPQNDKAFGNNELKETNVITIADLKAKYSNVIFASTDDTVRIAEDIQIKGRVTGNDIGGNIYSSVAIDDGTGCLLIGISQGGLFAFLPVGQEVLISLKGLYIGGYGQQPQLGMPYTNASGRTYVSRMSRYVWEKHYKLIGTADASKVSPVIFDLSKLKDETYRRENAGKLMTIQNVSFEGADGTKAFAPDAEKDRANSVNRTLDGITSSNLVVRTSSYADFAAMPMPQGKYNVTGVFTRFRNTWQILIRDVNDLQKVSD